MLLLAINDYLELLGLGAPQAARWTKTRDEFKHNIRKYLWDEKIRSSYRTSISPARHFLRISTRTQSTTTAEPP
jgi:GH15 family glucan-1,4-alpha-glucosidase